MILSLWVNGPDHVRIINDDTACEILINDFDEEIHRSPEWHLIKPMIIIIIDLRLPNNMILIFNCAALLHIMYTIL